MGLVRFLVVQKLIDLIIWQNRFYSHTIKASGVVENWLGTFLVAVQEAVQFLM